MSQYDDEYGSFYSQVPTGNVSGLVAAIESQSSEPSDHVDDSGNQPSAGGLLGSSETGTWMPTVPETMPEPPTADKDWSLGGAPFPLPMPDPGGWTPPSIGGWQPPTLGSWGGDEGGLDLTPGARGGLPWTDDSGAIDVMPGTNPWTPPDMSMGKMPDLSFTLPDLSLGDVTKPFDNMMQMMMLMMLMKN